MKIRALTTALLLAASTLPAFAADSYDIDPRHSQVRFKYSHFGFSNIVGILPDVNGKIVYDAANPAASKVDATIGIASVRTGIDKLDQHLQAADFFDIAQFPQATFRSTKVAAAGDGKLRVDGDLTIHGVTRPISLDVKLNAQGKHPMSGAPAIGFDATTALKRSEFGVGKYAPNVSDDVAIEITIEATGPKL